MKEPLKYFLEQTAPFGTLARLYRNRQLKKKYDKWKESGAVPPLPNLGKQRVVIEYLKRFSIDTFIETGTYKGKMVYAVIPHVKEIYSVELDNTHFQNARKRFRGYPNIHILHGQSGEILPKILGDIDRPCLFWLDAHWSGGSTAKGTVDTPIVQELKCVVNHVKADKHIILIDDARCFTGKNDYPTLEFLKKYISGMFPDWIFEINDDIIRIYSGRRAAAG